MSGSALTMPDVVGFIQEKADAGDRGTVHEAIKTCRKLLRTRPRPR